jgi:hypothetical protein
LVAFSKRPGAYQLRTATGELLSTDEIAVRVVTVKGFDPGVVPHVSPLVPRRNRLRRPMVALETRCESGQEN